MRAFTHWILSLFLNPTGVIVLAALDSTTFFWLPLGIDAVVIILSARYGSYSWIVPLLAAGGSVAGAWLTFWMGTKIGEKGLDRHVPQKRLAYIRKRIRNSGAITLAALDLIPPPFPFTLFVLAAGALEVSARTFFITLTACRILRFGVEAALAVLYGRRILRWLDSDLFHDIVGTFIILAIVITTLSIIRLVRLSRPQRRRAAA